MLARNRCLDEIKRLRFNIYNIIHHISNNPTLYSMPEAFKLLEVVHYDVYRLKREIIRLHNLPKGNSETGQDSP